MSDPGFFAGAPQPAAPPAYQPWGAPPPMPYGAIPPYGAPPPYGVPPMGYGQPYGPPQRGNKKGWIIAGSVAGVVGLLIVAAVVFVVHQFGQAKGTVKQYLTDMQNGQYAAAYELHCPADQLAVSESEFESSAALVHPVSWTINGVQVHDVNGLQTAEVTYSATESHGEQAYDIVVPLVKQSGRWEICR